MAHKPIRILGVMTGTSCDGIDASCLEFHPSGTFRIRWNISGAYPKKLRQEVLAAQNPGTRLTTQDHLSLETNLGAFYARQISTWVREHSVKPMVIANHGQTLAHFPDIGATWQAGNSSLIAAKTGLTTVCQFREGDMAHGGQGAPIVPAYHLLLMKQTLKKSAAGVAIHNLGGISNLTYWDGKGSPLAFDTGPANVWIDAAIDRVSRGRHKFDRDGRAAAQGKVDGKAIEKLLAHPYFSRRPPKSTGRDDFPPSLFFSATRAQGNDLVATATELSAQSIARAYHRFVLARAMPLERIYFCGGGAKNSTLLCRIAELLPSVEIFTTTALGADPQYIESQAFAYLGWRALNGIAVGGNWTGAAPNAPSPHLIPGRNWAAVTPLL